jgi:DNA-binding GntR family transcriptional regulator
VNPAGDGERPHGPRESLSSKAVRDLEELIVTLQLEPGQIVSEAELSDRLGISRTPVREALQHLATDQLVVITPRRAIRISEVSVESQLLMAEVRRVIERLLVTRATRLASPAQQEEFRALAGEIVAAAGGGDEVGFLRIDRRFNELVGICARNPFATRAVEPLHAHSRRFWHVHRFPTDLSESAALHADAMEAIGAGDVERAIAAHDALLAYVEGFVRAIISRQHQ